MTGFRRGSPAWWHAIQEGLGDLRFEVSHGRELMTALCSPRRLDPRSELAGVVDIRVPFGDGRAGSPEWWGPAGWEPLAGRVAWQVRLAAQRLREQSAQKYYGALECDL